MNINKFLSLLGIVDPIQFAVENPVEHIKDSRTINTNWKKNSYQLATTISSNSVPMTQTLKMCIKICNVQTLSNMIQSNKVYSDIFRIPFVLVMILLCYSPVSKKMATNTQKILCGNSTCNNGIIISKYMDSNWLWTCRVYVCISYTTIY